MTNLDASRSLARYAASRGRQSWVVVDEGPLAEPRYVVTAASMLTGTERVVFFASDVFGGGKTDGSLACNLADRIRRSDRVAYRRRRTGV